MLVGGRLVELQLGCIPLERGLREAHCDAADQHRFCQGAGVAEAGGSRLTAAAGGDKQAPVVGLGGLGELEVLKLLVGIEQRPGDMRHEDHALRADQHRAGVGQFVPFEQGEDVHRGFLRAIIPG